MAMLQCWKKDPQERPSFLQLVGELSAKLTEMANYLDLNEMDATAAATVCSSSESEELSIN